MKECLTTLKKGMSFLLSRMAALFLVSMTCLVLYQVFTRYVLNNPSDFTEEIVRYLLIWTGFIGAAYAFLTRQHMALIFVRDKFKGNKKKALMCLIDMGILLFALFVIVIGGTKLVIGARHGFSALLGIPRSLVYSMAPISGILIIIGQVINLWEDVTGIEIGHEGGNQS